MRTGLIRAGGVKPPPWPAISALVDPAFQGLWDGLLGLWSLGPELTPFDLGPSNAGRMAQASGAALPALSSSEFGPVLSFDGSSTGLATINSLFDLADKQHLTLMAISSRTGTTDEAAIFRTNWKGSNDNLRFSLVYTGTNNLQPRFEIRDSTGTFKSVFAPQVTQGELNVIVGTFDSGTLRIYVDGLEEGSNGTAGSDIDTPTEPTELAIGYLDGAAGVEFFLNGEVAIAAIWNRTLSPTEIARISADPFGLFRPNWDYAVAAAAEEKLQPARLIQSQSVRSRRHQQVFA